jgi:flagellar hook-associated protein 3
MVRITQNLLNNRTLLNLQNNILRMARLQDQLSTGRRINRAADDPVDYPTTLSMRTTINRNRSYMSNIQGAQTNLELTDTTMGSLTEVLQTIRTLAVQGGNSADTPARLAIATQIRELYGQVMDLANANFNGQYIFGGSETKKAAFVSQNGTILYQGDDFQRQVAIGKNNQITSNLTGLQTFLHTPNQITASVSVADIDAPLAEQLRLAHPDFPNLPTIPASPSQSSVDRSANPDNYPTSTPNNYAEFYIYDTKIRVDLTADSLADVRNRINANSKDVVASINEKNQLVITSKRADALDLRDGSRDVGYPADPPMGANLLGALGLHRRVENQRPLNSGYPATNPLTDGTTQPAATRSTVRVQNDSFLFVGANTGPATNPAVPFGDNLAITDVDAEGNEAVDANENPVFINQLEAIRITIDEEVIDIDLRSLTQGRDFDGTAGNEDDVPGSTLGDLLDLINNHPQLNGRATAFINADGTGIGITAVNSADVFKVENVRKLFGRDITMQTTIVPAEDPDEDPIVSVTRMDPLEMGTKLKDLPGALVDPEEGSLGIRVADPPPAGQPPSLNKGLIVISNNGETETIDLRYAETIGDVISAINDSKVGVRAEINETKTGINIYSITDSNDSLSVVDMAEGTTARDLGLFIPPAPARIRSIEDVSATDIVGDAIPDMVEGEFTIEVRDGTGQTLETYTIAVSPFDTLQDIADRIDAADGQSGTGGGLISVNFAGDRLNIVSNYNGHTLLIDPANDTTGVDETTRFSEFYKINQYTAMLEEDAETLVPYVSKQNTASVLGWNAEGKVNEIEEQNLFLTINNLEWALRNDDTDAIGQALENLDIDLDVILTNRTTTGARLNRLDAAQSRLQDGEDLLRQQLSTIEDVDFAQLISEYTLAQNAFNAALSASSRIIQQTLLDFL